MRGAGASDVAANEDDMRRGKSGNGGVAERTQAHPKKRRRGSARPGDAGRNRPSRGDRARRKERVRHASGRMVPPYVHDELEDDELDELEERLSCLPVGCKVRNIRVVDPSADDDECCVGEERLRCDEDEERHVGDCHGEFDDGESDDDFDIEDLEELAELFHRRRMEEGIAEAEREWLDEPFSKWNESLAHGREGLDHDCACKLVVAMADELAARDALILSLVGDLRGEKATRTMLRCATHPHDPGNVLMLYRRLDRAFNDATLRPDSGRCKTGVDMLLDMASRSPGRFCVQPLCVVAYTLWWLGDGEAGDFARRALEHDGSCVLARIICSAVDDGLCPAWLQ